MKMSLTLRDLQLAASVLYPLLIYPKITGSDIVTKKLKKHAYMKHKSIVICKWTDNTTSCMFCRKWFLPTNCTVVLHCGHSTCWCLASDLRIHSEKQPLLQAEHINHQLPTNIFLSQMRTALDQANEQTRNYEGKAQLWQHHATRLSRYCI